MFYKEECRNSQIISDFLYSAEFCYAIYEKMNILPSVALVDLHCYDHEGNIIQSFPLPVIKNIRDTENEININSYINIKGNYNFYTSSSFSEKYFIEQLNDHYKDKGMAQIVTISHNNMSFNEFIQKYPLNNEKVQKAQALLDNFFNLESQGILYDKSKEPYYYQIVCNSDINIGENLIVDELLLYKIKDEIRESFDNKRTLASKLKLIDRDSIESIGYLKVKYTTNEIVQFLDQKLQENYPDATSTMTIKSSNVSSKNNNKLKEVSPFLNVAGIDYSNINEPYKNKGLGYSMYFQMAKYLTLKDIEFRQSSINSQYAKRLWEGIQKHWKDNITLKPFMNNNLCFLSIGQDCILDFKNSQPVIKTNKKLKA